MQGFAGGIMRLRHEEPGDEQQIAAMVAAAFVGKPYSHQNEHFIIDGLRRDGAMTISLVAEDAGAIVGHVAFSPITVDDREVNWHGMGPVAVAPARQL
jgi:putative acetyltransferase